MSPRPGRVANIHEVHIERPRTAQTRASQELGRMAFDIYTELSGSAGRGDEGRAGPHW